MLFKDGAAHLSKVKQEETLIKVKLITTCFKYHKSLRGENFRSNNVLNNLYATITNEQN